MRISEDRPRVLIVESDPDLALAMVRECLDVGLEPKLCLAHDVDCPAEFRGECPRNRGISAAFVSLDSIAKPTYSSTCAGRVRTITAGSSTSDDEVSFPEIYDPRLAAVALLKLARQERQAPL